MNRVWKELFGRGLVEPVDDLRPTNPASHPELLEALSAEFVKEGLDLRQLIRLRPHRQHERRNPKPRGPHPDLRIQHLRPRRQLLLNERRLALIVPTKLGQPILLPPNHRRRRQIPPQRHPCAPVLLDGDPFQIATVPMVVTGGVILKFVPPHRHTVHLQRHPLQPPRLLPGVVVFILVNTGRSRPAQRKITQLPAGIILRRPNVPVWIFHFNQLSTQRNV